MQTRIFHAPDISCGHCEKVIRQSLEALPGVKRVAVDIPNQNVEVDFDERKLLAPAIEASLVEAGYPATLLSHAGENFRTDVVEPGGSCCGSCHL